MEKNYLIQLTKELYRLTLLFPKKEPLRYKMREIADEILANWLRNTNKDNRGQTSAKLTGVRPLQILGDLEVLDGFFEVAKAQNWVKPIELLRLQEEYNRIKAEIKKITKQPPEKEILESQSVDVRRQHLPVSGINERQEKILEFLRENGRAQVWQIKQIFPEVSKRTLRRDFDFLLNQGKIERIGERNNTFYQLRSLAP